jgi:hypothetical protein
MFFLKFVCVIEENKNEEDVLNIVKKKVNIFSHQNNRIKKTKTVIEMIIVKFFFQDMSHFVFFSSFLSASNLNCFV